MIKHASMVSAELGLIVVPKNAEAARGLAVLGYRSLDPERFPWRCPTELERDALIGTGLYGTRCTLVEGHEGEHRGEVSWA